jgi:hypothetical protein
MSESWWHVALKHLAEKLPISMLSEMKHRIQRGRIQKQQLELNENTARMKAFFGREIERYKKRKEYMSNRSQAWKRQQVEIKELKRQVTECEKQFVQLTKNNEANKREIALLRPVMQKLIKRVGIETLRKMIA